VGPGVAQQMKGLGHGIVTPVIRNNRHSWTLVHDPALLACLTASMCKSCLICVFRQGRFRSEMSDIKFLNEP
jgi:hypothetical protein